MANIISIGHLKLTPADMRAIFDHADALIAEEIVGEVTSRRPYPPPWNRDAR